MANDIVVRVGAVLDRSFDVVMGEIEKRSQRAQRAQARAANGGMGGGDMYGPGRREFAKSIAYREALQRASERKMVSESEKAERKRTTDALREIRIRAQAEAALNRQRSSAMMSQFREEERAAEAHRNKMLRAELGAARRRDREVDRFATRTSHRATRFFFPPPEGALGVAKRIGLDIARGAGVDFSLSGGIGRAREREARAVALSNQGWNPNVQAEKDRITASQLRSTAREQAARLGLAGEMDVLNAMGKFTDVTGDLATAKSVIGDIGLLARATGTSLEDAAGAAADMTLQLPETMDVNEKTAAIKRLLSVAAMQGKLGAVEVYHMAKFMPKIISGAAAFQGDTSSNITKLMAIAQVARKLGGAANPAIAATSVASMVNTLKTPARVKEFEAHGVQVYNEKGQFRDIQQIIKESIIAAKNPVEFKKMWANVQGARAVEGFKTIYTRAGGGKAGLDAIDAEFAKFTSALDPEAQKKMLEGVTGTMESTANRFQQRLDAVTEQLGSSLMPTLEKMAPIIIQVTEAFSKAVAWAADNPGKAITAAIVASIGRAGIESGIRLLLDRAANNLLGGGPGGFVPGPGGGVVPGRPGLLNRGTTAVGGALNSGMGPVANTLGVISVAAASFMITDAILNSANTTVQEARTRQATSANDIVSQFREKYQAATTEDERAQAKQWALKNLEMDQSSRGPLDLLTGNSDVYFKSIKAINDAELDADRFRTGTKQQRNMSMEGPDSLTSNLELAVAKAFDGALQKTLTVRVSNTEDFKLYSEMGSSPGPEPPRFP